MTASFPDRFNPDAPDSYLADVVGVALTSAVIDQVTHEKHRPLLVLSIMTTDLQCCPKHGPRAIQVLCTWSQLAELEGQLRAARETVSLNRQDQWQAHADRVYTLSKEIVREGRPVDG